MSGLSDVERLAAILHGTRITLSESCAVCAKARSDARRILGSAWMTERDAAIRDEALAPIRDYLEGTFTWLHGYKSEDAILKVVHDLRALLDGGDN